MLRKSRVWFDFLCLGLTFIVCKLVSSEQIIYLA